MSVTSRVILAGVAAVSLYYGKTQLTKEFSADEVFRRARPQIELLMRSDPATRDMMIDGLKADLSIARDDTQRCRVGLLAEATAHARGNKEAAGKMLERRSFTPYSECEPDQREGNSPNKWYVYGGAVGLIITGISLLVNLVGALRGRAAARRVEAAERRERAARRREEDEEPIDVEESRRILIAASDVLRESDVVLRHPLIGSVDPVLVRELRDIRADLSVASTTEVRDVDQIRMSTYRVSDVLRRVQGAIRLADTADSGAP